MISTKQDAHLSEAEDESLPATRRSAASITAAPLSIVAMRISWPGQFTRGVSHEFHSIRSWVVVSDDQTSTRVSIELGTLGEVHS